MRSYKTGVGTLNNILLERPTLGPGMPSASPSHQIAVCGGSDIYMGFKPV